MLGDLWPKELDKQASNTCHICSLIAKVKRWANANNVQFKSSWQQDSGAHRPETKHVSPTLGSSEWVQWPFAVFLIKVCSWVRSRRIQVLQRPGTKLPWRHSESVHGESVDPTVPGFLATRGDFALAWKPEGWTDRERRKQPDFLGWVKKVWGKVELFPMFTLGRSSGMSLLATSRKALNVARQMQSEGLVVRSSVGQLFFWGN